MFGCDRSTSSCCSRHGISAVLFLTRGTAISTTAYFNCHDVLTTAMVSDAFTVKVDHSESLMLECTMQEEERLVRY